MRISISFVIILIIFILNSSAKSQWIPCQGIEGGTVYSITCQDTDLFIVRDGGIFKRQIDAELWDSACLVYNVSKVRSTGTALFAFGGNIMSDLFRSLDNGNTWEELDHDGYKDIEAVDHVIFIGTYGSLNCSSDNGETWTNNYPASVLDDISVLYSQPGMLFCQVEGVDTLFRSDNYGNSWIKYPLNGITGKVCSYLFNCTLWLAQGNNFYIYNDPEQEWIMQNDSLLSGTFVSNFIEDAGSLGCYSTNGYFLFDELNSTWQNHSQGLEKLGIWDACKADGTIYLATDSGPFSKTGDEDWTPQYNDLFGLAVTHAFVFNGKTYALANEKIYYSHEIENGFETLETQGYCPAYDLVVTQDGWYEGSSCGFSISLDSGQTWTDFSNGLEGLFVHKVAKTNVYYYAATYREQGLYRSHTYHNAWEPVPNELGSIEILDLEVLDNKIFASTNSGLYRSADFGTSFSLLAEAGIGNILLVRNNALFFMRDYDIIYSTDIGNTWQMWIDYIDVAYPMCLDVNNSLDATVLGGFVGPWDPHSYLKIFKLEYPYWNNIIDDLPPYLWSFIQDVLIDNEKIFACPSSGGLWYRDDLMVGIDENEYTQPTSSSQLIVYPNPARDLISIHFDNNIEVSEYHVFDYSGRMMMKGKINERKANISVEIAFLSPGMYLILVLDNKGNTYAGKFLKNK